MCHRSVAALLSCSSPETQFGRGIRVGIVVKLLRTHIANEASFNDLHHFPVHGAVPCQSIPVHIVKSRVPSNILTSVQTVKYAGEREQTIFISSQTAY